MLHTPPSRPSYTAETHSPRPSFEPLHSLFPFRIAQSTGVVGPRPPDTQTVPSRSSARPLITTSAYCSYVTSLAPSHDARPFWVPIHSLSSRDTSRARKRLSGKDIPEGGCQGVIFTSS